MFNSTEITIINKLCDKYKFEYIVYDDMIYIRSKYDSWRIIKNDCTYKLYHKNRSKHTCNLNQSCEDMGNYHFQSECQDMTKLSNIINYLKDEDIDLLYSDRMNRKEAIYYAEEESNTLYFLYSINLLIKFSLVSSSSTSSSLSFFTLGNNDLDLIYISSEAITK